MRLVGLVQGCSWLGVPDNEVPGVTLRLLAPHRCVLGLPAVCHFVFVEERGLLGLFLACSMQNCGEKMAASIDQKPWAVHTEGSGGPAQP